MKNMFENSEVFKAYAILDFCGFELRRIMKELNAPRSPIVIMIDRATGYHARYKKEIAEILKTIIEKKKFVEMDASEDEALLEQLLAINTDVISSK